MKKISLLVFLSSTFLYAMNDEVEVTLANNQKVLLPKIHLKRLALSSTMLKNAAQDLNNDEQLPTYLPFIEDSAALERMNNLLNDNGTPNTEQCLSQTKNDWCKIAPALAALEIECLNPYLLGKLENAYSSPIFCKALLQGSAHSFTHETLPPTFKDELARRINRKNVEVLSGIKVLCKTLKSHTDQVNAITISPDDQTLIGPNTNKVRSIAIASDGQIIVSGSGDTTIKLWDLNTGLVRQILTNHKNEISSIAISPDEQMKNDLLQAPLETSLLIQALQTRPNHQEPFTLIGKPYEHFKQLRSDAQDFLCKELNVITP